MSRTYTIRIRDIVDSYLANLASLQYIERHYNDENIAFEFIQFELKQIRVATVQIEDAFFVRLFVEYQGILKDHLKTNHPDVLFDDQNSDLDWLLSQIRDRNRLSVNPKLREQFQLARTYRNHIAHNSSPYPRNVSISEAAEYLSKIVSKFASL